jgi:hypothetical protein
MKKKVKVIVDYRDLELNRIVRKNEEIEVTEEREKLLVSKKFVKPISIKDKEDKAPVATKELKTVKKSK